MHLFIHRQLILIYSFIGILIPNQILQTRKVHPPMTHYREILLLTWERLILLILLLIGLVLPTLVLLHLLPVLFELYIVLCFFYLIHILMQTNLLLIWSLIIIHAFRRVTSIGVVVDLVCEFQLILLLLLLPLLL